MRRPSKPAPPLPAVLRPDAGTLAKLGSIIAHVEEGLSAGGHEFDWVAARQLLADPAVVEWMAGMRKLAMLPEPRTRRTAAGALGWD